MGQLCPPRFQRGQDGVWIAVMSTRRPRANGKRLHCASLESWRGETVKGGGSLVRTTSDVYCRQKTPPRQCRRTGRIYHDVVRRAVDGRVDVGEVYYSDLSRQGRHPAGVRWVGGCGFGRVVDPPDRDSYSVEWSWIGFERRPYITGGSCEVDRWCPFCTLLARWRRVLDS